MWYSIKHSYPNWIISALDIVSEENKILKYVPTKHRRDATVLLGGVFGRKSYVLYQLKDGGIKLYICDGEYKQRNKLYNFKS